MDYDGKPQIEGFGSVWPGLPSHVLKIITTRLLLNQGAEYLKILQQNISIVL